LILSSYLLGQQVREFAGAAYCVCQSCWPCQTSRMVFYGTRDRQGQGVACGHVSRLHLTTVLPLACVNHNRCVWLLPPSRGDKPLKLTLHYFDLLGICCTTNRSLATADMFDPLLQCGACYTKLEIRQSLGTVHKARFPLPELTTRVNGPS